MCNYKCDDISTSKVSERLQSLTSICGLHRDLRTPSPRYVVYYIFYFYF